MDDGERVDPDPPPSELELDRVVEQHAEEGEDHVGDLLLLGVLGVDVGQGDEPLLKRKISIALVNSLQLPLEDNMISLMISNSILSCQTDI